MPAGIKTALHFIVVSFNSFLFHPEKRTMTRMLCVAVPLLASMTATSRAKALTKYETLISLT